MNATDTELFQLIKARCAQASDGIYRTEWTQFMADTGGYTINSLVSYGLYPMYVNVWCDTGCAHYFIQLVEEVAA